MNFYHLFAEVVPNIRFINCGKPSQKMLFQRRKIRNKPMLESLLELIPAFFYRVEFWQFRWQVPDR